MIRNSSDTIWLFDYDLTLYGEEERLVLDSLDRRISLSVQKAVGGTFEEASEIRKEYLLKFGTTLAGLQAMHGVKPDDFFDFIHVPEFLTYPKYSPEKQALLQKLQGHKYVFTNGRGDWSKAGMKSMGILDLMDGVFDLKQMDWIGKPHESAYDKMLAYLAEKGCSPDGNARRIVLLEDSLRNLEPAHRRGWTTVYVGSGKDVPEWVDYHIHHLLDIPSILSI